MKPHRDAYPNRGLQCQSCVIVCAYAPRAIRTSYAQHISEDARATQTRDQSRQYNDHISLLILIPTQPLLTLAAEASRSLLIAQCASLLPPLHNLDRYATNMQHYNSMSTESTHSHSQQDGSCSPISMKP